MHPFFKSLCHVIKAIFRSFVLRFSYIAVHSACCGGVPGLSADLLLCSPLFVLLCWHRGIWLGVSLFQVLTFGFSLLCAHSGPWFLMPLLLGKGCVLPGKKIFWDPGKCGHWRFWVKCVSRYWDLTFRYKDELEGVAERVLGGRKAVCSSSISLVLREWGELARRIPSWYLPPELFNKSYIKFTDLACYREEFHILVLN